MQIDERKELDHANENQGKPEQEPLFIFVNRRKFGRSEGVAEKMTGARIAGLVGVPEAIAVVRLDSGPDRVEIAVNQVVEIKSGEQFLVTRKVVEGGCAA